MSLMSSRNVASVDSSCPRRSIACRLPHGFAHDPAQHGAEGRAQGFHVRGFKGGRFSTFLV